MSEQLETLSAEFSEIVAEARIYRYFVRAREGQERTLKRLEELKNRAASLKAEMIEAQNEAAANRLLAIEFILDGLASEFRMWLALKADEPEVAWAALVRSQSLFAAAPAAHPPLQDDVDELLARLRTYEMVLFPPQQFLSAGFRIRESRCSICESDYGECDHVAGEVYMGRICARQVLKCDISEVSLVTNPADRGCRIERLQEDDGSWRNVMTWRVIEPSTEPTDDRFSSVSEMKDEDSE